MESNNDYRMPGCHRLALPAIVALLIAPATAMAVDPAVIAAERQRIDLIERIAPSVVAIFAPGGQGGGSGVLISGNGYTITNFHVVQGLGPFMKCGLNDGIIYDAVLVGIDPTGDVAMIKLLGRDDFPHSTLADSAEVSVGDFAYALGNPFLLAADLQPTVTYGMVSGVHRYQAPAGTTSWNTRTAFRLTRRSIPVTREDRCSTSRERSSASMVASLLRNAAG